LIYDSLLFKKKTLSGNGTFEQLAGYLILGTMFWSTIIIALNIIDAKRNAFHFTFLTKTCNREYKRCLYQSSLNVCNEAFFSCRGNGLFIMPDRIRKIPDKTLDAKENLIFTDDEQQYNIRLCRQYIFYDRALCNELCEATNDEQCEKICYIQRKASPDLSQICPYGNLRRLIEPTTLLKINTVPEDVLAIISAARKLVRTNLWDTGE
jgi:hypothetical protein